MDSIIILLILSEHARPRIKMTLGILRMMMTKSKSNQHSLIQDSFLQQQIYTYTVQCTLNFSENLFFHTFEAGSAPIYFSSYLHPRVVEAIRVSIQQIYN